MPPAAILDVDGTLVDTNYHHTLAWYRAFRQNDVVLAMWRIHRHMGMGGDQLVESLCGEQVEEEKGGKGSHDERGHTVVLSSSAKAEEVEHYVELLDARELVDDWTSSADVEATKPEPDLIQAAVEKAGGEAVMVGDSTWDCEAAKRAGLDTIAVLTGGFSEPELRESLEETPLAAS